VIGAFCTLADLCAFNLLYVYTNKPIVSSAIGVSIGIGLSYFLNSRFNFDKKLEFRSFTKFILTGISGLILSSLIVQTGIWIGFDPRVSKLASIPLVTIAQFLVNARWTFRVN
jgi:putative flippase GtrA